MNFKEVKSSFISFEDKRHEILKKTQFYFAQRGFQSYVWFDEKHRLRIKYKYRRGIENFSFDNNKERDELYNILQDFCKKFDIKVRFILDLCETDVNLKESIQSQWSTEFIIEV